MKYLKLLDDMTQYESYLYGENMVTPSVCFLTQENIVRYDPIDSQPIVLAVGEQIFRTDVADKSWEIWNDIMRDFPDIGLSNLYIFMYPDEVILHETSYGVDRDVADISHYEWVSWLRKLKLYNPYYIDASGTAYNDIMRVTLSWNYGIGFERMRDNNWDNSIGDVVLVYMDKNSSDYGITYWPG